MRDCGGAREARLHEPERAAVWPKVIIFDCDGVIVDSETIALERTRAVLRRYGLELSAEEARERFLGVSAQAIRAHGGARSRREAAGEFPRRTDRATSSPHSSTS